MVCGVEKQVGHTCRCDIGVLVVLWRTGGYVVPQKKKTNDPTQSSRWAPDVDTGFWLSVDGAADGLVECGASLPLARVSSRTRNLRRVYIPNVSRDNKGNKARKETMSMCRCRLILVSQPSRQDSPTPPPYFECEPSSVHPRTIKKKTPHPLTSPPMVALSVPFMS